MLGFLSTFESVESEKIGKVGEGMYVIDKDKH